MPRQAKSPSLTRDLLMLGDVYLTLGWVAIQRLRHGPLWPWDVPPRRAARILTLPPSLKEDREEEDTATARRG
jgi:hypothetical protein